MRASSSVSKLWSSLWSRCSREIRYRTLWVSFGEHLHDLRFNFLKLTKDSQKLLCDSHRINTHGQARFKEVRNAEMKGKHAHPNISKAIKGTQADPISYLKWDDEGPDGQLKWACTTSPHEIDFIS